uniref:Uncharacterized protein n=1 Tax=Arundo donax TaxID=35708 RepID=A0A0A9GS78_ARUDO
MYFWAYSSMLSFFLLDPIAYWES